MANDLAAAIDPTKKKPLVNGALPGDGPMLNPVDSNTSVPAPAADPQFLDKAVPGPTYKAGGGFDQAVPGPTFKAGAPAAAPAPAAPAAPAGLPAGATDVGNGMVKFADGQVLPMNHPAYAAKVAAMGAPAATPGAPAPSAPVPGQPAAPTVADTFKQALMAKLNPTGPMDASNPAIAPAIQANKLAEQRNFESQRNTLAERAAANGQNNSGGFEAGLTGLAEDRAAREGQFAGNAVQHLSDQQNQGILAALGIGAQTTEGQNNRDLQSIMQDKSLSAQEKMAQMDAAVRREGIASQSAIGNKDIDVRQLLGLLGLQQNGQQFGQSLGAQIGMNTAGLNQQAILSMLGGL